MTEKNPVLTKANYKIDDLIANAVQPFEDLTDEELTALGADLDPKAGLPMAIISSDGIVIDGVQRLRALRKKGRANVPATSLLVEARASQDNALDWSIKLNSNRRQLSGEAKAKVMLRLMNEHGWSQGVVAEKFGMTRQGVSFLLKQYTADGDQPSAVRVGKDGVVRDTSAISGTPKPRSSGPRGYIYAEGTRTMKHVAELTRNFDVLKINPETLPPEKTDWIREQLLNLKDAITARLAELDGEDLEES